MQTTKQDVLDLVRLIGTQERPVTVWRWVAILNVSIVLLAFIVATPTICPTCDFGAGSYIFLTVLGVVTVIIACFCLFGLLQYMKYRNM